MCLIGDRNLWKAFMNMVIFLEVLERGISCNVSCLTYFYVVRRLAINQYTYCDVGMLKFEAY
jgi:hypothetical protein